MSNYQKGRRFEYFVRDKLKKNGYFLIRSAKSSFPDLIAIKKATTFKSTVLAIECKDNKTNKGYLTQKETTMLSELNRNYGLVPCRAYSVFIKRKKYARIERLCSDKTWKEVVIL